METNTNKSESNEKEYFSEHGQNKKHNGTEGQRESDGRTDCTG